MRTKCKILGWDKFNEELSPLTVHNVVTELRKKGHSKRSYLLGTNYVFQYVKKYILQKGVQLSDNLYFGDVIVSESKDCVYVIPILFFFDKSIFRLSITSYIKVGFDGGISAERYTDRRMDKIKSDISTIIKTDIVQDFCDDNMDDIIQNIKVPDNDDDIEKIHNDISKTIRTTLDNRVGNFHDIELNRSQTVKVLNAFKSEIKCVEDAYEDIKDIIDEKKMDVSLGEVRDFIKNLKVNDFYLD